MSNYIIHSKERRTVLKGYAKELRRTPTGAEARFNHIVKSNYLGRYRKQYIIGSIIVDAAFLDRNLLVEIDGSSHDGTAKITKDSKRDLWLKGLGFNILRFTNDDVFSTPQIVVNAINSFKQSAENRRLFQVAKITARRATFARCD